MVRCDDAGTPNLATQSAKSALAQSTVVVEFKGIASGQREVLSMMVKRWVKPLDAWRGPTRSMWMWLNRQVGTGMCCGGTWTWRWTLARWQCRQARAQTVTLVERPFQTYLEAMRRREVRIPG